MNIKEIIEGSKKFKNHNFLEYKEKFTDLVVNGQKPKVLFIGCCDSRVVPNLITNSAPGDLFIVRNIGNFVPSYDMDFSATPAAIEYAVSVLKVDTIVVCGHSQCGAINSLYQDIDSPDLKHVKKWLTLGEKAKNIVDFTNKNDPLDKKLTILERVSAVFQAENLMTYPAIKKAVADKKLEIRVWYYKIEDGTIEEYDKKNSEFVAINEAE